MKKVKVSKTVEQIKPIPRTAIYVGLKSIGQRKMRELTTITKANALRYFKKAKWLEIGGVEAVKEAGSIGSMRLEAKHDPSDQGQKHLRAATAGVDHYPFKVVVDNKAFIFAGQPLIVSAHKRRKTVRLFDVNIDSRIYETEEPKLIVDKRA